VRRGQLLLLRLKNLELNPSLLNLSKWKLAALECGDHIGIVCAAGLDEHLLSATTSAILSSSYRQSIGSTPVLDLRIKPTYLTSIISRSNFRRIVSAADNVSGKNSPSIILLLVRTDWLMSRAYIDNIRVIQKSRVSLAEMFLPLE